MDQVSNLQKKCGFCGENIPAAAKRCPYCGSVLEVTVDESFGMNQPEQPVNTGFDGQNEPERKEPAQEAQQPVNIQDSDRHNAYRPYGNSGYTTGPNYGSNLRQPLSNGMKVFLTVLFTVLPGIGQLAGIIAAIVFMNTEGDNDRKSFGVALLIASLIMFVISCISCFILVIGLSANQVNY